MRKRLQGVSCGFLMLVKELFFPLEQEAVGPIVGLAATAKSNALHVREETRRSGEPSHIKTDVL